MAGTGEPIIGEDVGYDLINGEPGAMVSFGVVPQPDEHARRRPVFTFGVMTIDAKTQERPESDRPGRPAKCRERRGCALCGRWLTGVLHGEGP